MNELNSYESIVKKKTEGKILFLKISLAVAYTLLATIGFLLTFFLADGSPAVLLIVVAIVCAVIFFTWRLSCVEYEHSVISGTFFLAKIYGRSSRKEVFEAEMTRAALIAPYDETYSEKANASAPDKIYYAVSSMDSDELWFIIFDEDGKKTLIFFEAKERILSVMRHEAPRAFVRMPKNSNSDGGK